jgi:hypothetical protein
METIVFNDAYTGEEKYGRIDRVYGCDIVLHLIAKEEAGPNPRRIVMRPDPRIAKITGGTGIIN